MPMDLDESLTPSAIVEYHAAIDQGRSHAQAIAAAVDRVRFEVLRMAALMCELRAQQPDMTEEMRAACHGCAKDIEARL